MKLPRLKNISPAYRITGIYLLLGLIWILFSDIILTWFVKDVETMRLMQTFKGWFYVIVTSFLFFLLINSSFKRLDRARQSLEEAYVHYSYLFRNNPHPMWTYDCNARRITEVNEAAVKTYGYSQREFLQLSLEQLHHATDLENVAEILACNAPEFNRSSGFRHRRKDGSMIDVEMITHRLPGEDNHPMRLVSALDITGRKQAFEALKASEQALMESERQLSTLMSNLPGMAYRSLNDHNWTMLFASKGCLELTGYPDTDFLNNSVLSFGKIIHPDDQQRVWKEVQQKIYKKIPYPFTYRIITADGRIKWVWEQAVGVFDAMGKLKFIEGFISDITEQRTAEKALKDNNELLRSILDNLPFPMFYKSLQGHVLGCNKEFCEYLGKTHEQIIGQSAWGLLPHKKAMALEEIDRQVLSTMNDFRKEEQLVFADGKVVHAVYQKSLFFDAEGIPQGFIGLYFDITERIQAEKIIKRQLEDLERINNELEQFTYTVSHDLRSPLVTIKGSLNLLYEDIRAQNEVQINEGLSRIATATQRMHQLLEDLLQLSRIGRIGNPFSRFSMNELLAEVKHSLHGILAESGATLEVEANLPEVMGDWTRISEVFQNLVENAVKFRSSEREPLIRITSRREDGQNLFMVHDNGIGIEPAHLNIVFGLFKKLGNKEEGSGIGLPVVKRIVEHHGGKVWAESEGHGHGATFCFTLPEVPSEES